MERTATPPAIRDDIRARLVAELEGAAVTGMRPFRSPDGALMLTHTWVLTVGNARELNVV